MTSTIDCDNCETASESCSICGQSRCADHLVLTVSRASREVNGDEVQVLRATFADQVDVDYPVDRRLDDNARARWADTWASIESACVACRDAAAQRSSLNSAERGTKTASPSLSNDAADAKPAGEDPSSTEPDLQDHDELVRRRRETHGSEGAYRLQLRSIRGALRRSRPTIMIGLLVFSAVVASTVGGLLQLNDDWVQQLERALHDEEPVWLLSRLHRNRVAFLIAPLAAVVALLPLLMIWTSRARGRRRKLEDDLARVSAHVGCGSPGCVRCGIPRPGAFPLPIRPARLAVLALVLAGIAISVGWGAVVTPARSVNEFARTGVPAEIKHACREIQEPTAGDYELLCRSGQLRDRGLRQVMYRHYSGDPEFELTTSFESYDDFTRCRATSVRAGNSGRLIYCNPQGRRQAAIWTQGTGAIAAASGRKARKFALRESRRDWP